MNIAAGNNCIRDLWGRYGDGDMLDRAMQMTYRSVFRRDKDIELALRAATYGGAGARYAADRAIAGARTPAR